MLLDKSQLHSYQRYVADRMVREPALLAVLDMGMGKTAATLTALSELRDGFGYSKALIIAPKRVAELQWPSETAKWAHLSEDFTLSVVAGGVQQRLKALRQSADAYVISRDNVVWLVEHYKQEWPYDCVVIDESSSFKSHNSKRFKALKRARKYIDKVILLTGTPISSRGLLDLWPQAALLDGGERLGRTVTGFRQRYMTCDYMGYTWTAKPGAMEEVLGLLSDVMFSMRAEDYLELPEQQLITHWSAMTPKATEAYRRMVKDYVLPLADGGAITAVNAAVLSGKLLQLAGGALYDDNGVPMTLHDGKLEALDEILEGSGDEPLLVAYNYRHEAERIKARFKDVLDVKEPGAIAKWNERRLPGRIMLCHPQSAGHGLNLQTGGRRIAWFGLPWSLELYQQFNARLHRQGQRETVFVHHIATTGTIDERVLRALESREAGQAAVIDAVKAIVAEF